MWIHMAAKTRSDVTYNNYCALKNRLRPADFRLPMRFSAVSRQNRSPWRGRSSSFSSQATGNEDDDNDSDDDADAIYLESDCNASKRRPNFNASNRSIRRDCLNEITATSLRVTTGKRRPTNKHSFHARTMYIGCNMAGYILSHRWQRIGRQTHAPLKRCALA